MSARLYLVRHGRAEAGWDHALDPGLDALGHEQARALARTLGPLGPLPLVVSPLRRTRETAAPLEARWGITGEIEPRVAEIPSPPGVAMHERTTWLVAAMAGTWSDLDASYRDASYRDASYRDASYRRWRDEVVASLAATERDTVVVSHFIAINVAIGHALGDDRLVVAALDNCSITVIDVERGVFRLVEAGSEAPDTLVL